MRVEGPGFSVQGYGLRVKGVGFTGHAGTMHLKSVLTVGASPESAKARVGSESTWFSQGHI